MKILWKNFIFMFIIVSILNRIMLSGGVPQWVVLIFSFAMWMFAEHLGLPLVEEKDEK